MKKKFTKIFKMLLMMLNDILFIVGAAFITFSTYLINVNAGLYATGIFLLVFSFILSYKPKGGD